MDYWKLSSSSGAPSLGKAPLKFSSTVQEMAQLEQQDMVANQVVEADVDLREVYFLIIHFLSSGPCQRTLGLLWNELLEHQLLPRRYHAWFSRSGVNSGNDNDDGISFPLSYNKLVERYPHIEWDHLVKLLRQLLLYKASPFHGRIGGIAPNAADVPTLLGSGSFSLLECDRSMKYKQVKPLPAYLRWPHMQADQVHGLSLREIGGGFKKHHRAPSVCSACYAIAKPSTMVQKMQNIKKLRGHRDAVYCAIFDRSGRFVITGSDDRLVKIWSMETAFCLASCRGHEGDITDLAVSSNNTLVASASNDFVIRVWRLPDGLPISVLRGHTGAVTAIAFSPRPSAIYQLLSILWILNGPRQDGQLFYSYLDGCSEFFCFFFFGWNLLCMFVDPTNICRSSDDGTCRIWDARYSQYSPRIYLPKPPDAITGKSNVPSNNGPSSSNGLQSHQILCCAYNANGTVFVTGSSDTFARLEFLLRARYLQVWSACKSSVEDSEQPIHELDVLSGHENDVNYVQFSGCAVASRSAMSDAFKEENVPKFKNSWFCHDNIVTCSRDGSAIIWIPRSRRSHGKVGRWTRAYHLKVPPPPLPPQPPRGGPRQRLLPTPRGVNMIVWSLDNRFVLAAIMDCRICVWNAVDGSLVHSLTGHSASSYVLDVHPFNPRIAMSAGYDGRTIVWDIWEGTPIRIYEIGRFKLVDGKFSPDGTSIVLSDDVGQIYLLNTGQGESQKDAKYDQFFLGDYRPLIRDSLGNVLDQETQLVPHRRNIQDPLCDSSMIPYEEPYQSMYQQRRLGALGIEWRPSSIKLAIGLDFSLGQDYAMPPLEDLERMMEPVPEFIDPVYWEPENEVISDDNDSEYNIAEECASEAEQGSFCSTSSTDCSAGDSEVEHSRKDGRRRSTRRKHRAEVELKTSSGRRVRKRNLDERDGSASGSNRTKKSKNSQKALKKKSSKAKLLRPQRVAARNARSMFSRITGTSTGEDDSDSEYNSSNSDTVLQDSHVQSKEDDRNLQNMQQQHKREEEQTIVESEFMGKPLELLESQSDTGNRKRLVLKLSLRDHKKALSLEDTRVKGNDMAKLPQSSSGPPQGTTERKIDLSLKEPGSSSAGSGIDVGLSQKHNRIVFADGSQDEKYDSQLEESAGDMENKTRWAEVKIRTSKRSSSSGVLLPPDANFDVHNDSIGDVNRCVKLENGHGKFSSNSETSCYGCVRSCSDKEKFGSDALLDLASVRKEELARHEDIKKSSSFNSTPLVDHQQNDDVHKSRNEDVGTNYRDELKENPPLRVRIRTKGILRDTKSPSEQKSSTSVKDLPSAESDPIPMSESSLCMEGNLMSEVPEEGEGYGRSSSDQLLNSKLKFKVRDGSKSSYKTRTDIEAFDGGMEDGINHEASGIDSPEAASGSIRKTRSMKMKIISREPIAANCNFKSKNGHDLVGTSKTVGNSSMEAHDEFFPEEWIPTSTVKSRPRSTRNRRGDHDGHPCLLSGRKSNFPVRKLSWLMLSEHEEGYRYIPQLGDEVIYSRQGHQEFIESTGSQEVGPWWSINGYISAVETCKVENLVYATFPGSGDSCCKITLKFVDPSSSVLGKAFKLTLPELRDFPDFVVEKTLYDAAISRNWTHRDKCQIWWRNANGEGGTWWKGRITKSQAKSEEFPNSPWDRYMVEYKTGDSHLHSPWEMHDPNVMWEHPEIDSESRDKLLSSFNKLEQSVSRKQDYYGIQRLNEAAQKLDYLNRFPVPLYPEVIRLRLVNNYYRSLEAAKDDINVMLSNAESYFIKNAALSAKVERLRDWFNRTLNKL
ncbi:bromodomain and WD repeat-containing protein 1 isoform X2 [Citrus clementina]|uniref:bromodomain and WD repeat-containing protein 1 isoform X2 n=1 Tax=Citrus clementina TaxID=85681 RepID=UPI000CED69F0|nr:bromodomain and WD repeat-containing protein 1 isoform X2 [Citrus x clementina]